MAITINSNIAALNAQRRLTENSADLSRAFSRLSSGLRINRAGDDAAGLAVSAQLNVDARVYHQGVRNLNDGLSYLSIAEGATRELSSLVIRLRELATQASNGTYSDTQRRAIDTEVQSLQAEYNRTLNSASFNGRALFFNDDAQLGIQAGYGSRETLTLSFGDPAVNGTFKAGVAYSAGDNPQEIATFDANGDGILDLVNISRNDGAASIFFGNGDGTFKSRISYAVNAQPNALTFADVNRDGFSDMLLGSGGSVGVVLGNGNGTFKAPVSYDGGFGSYAIAAADFNNDGILDLAAPTNDGAVGIRFGNGNGTFKVRITYAGGDGNTLLVSDVNGDGVLDLLTAEYGAGKLDVLLGVGNGTFKAAATYTTQLGNSTIVAGDLNGDGIKDVVIASYTSNAVTLLFGNADGSYKAQVTYFGGTGTSEAKILDVNGDGKSDLVVNGATDSTLNIFLGNGNGSFKSRTSYFSLDSYSMDSGDLNGDGVLDIVNMTSYTDLVRVFLGNNGGGIRALSDVSVGTRSDALEAQTTLDAYLRQINSFAGSVGAFVSRLNTASGALLVRGENYISAAAQITDADISEESARLVRAKILQQASAAVLAQANQLPSLALTLLG